MIFVLITKITLVNDLCVGDYLGDYYVRANFVSNLKFCTLERTINKISYHHLPVRYYKILR